MERIRGKDFINPRFEKKFNNDIIIKLHKNIVKHVRKITLKEDV